ncbi:unnamed protein product [Penicillium salamii]|uniref:Fungal STAND N-terminal Goodbye domain-containing protein n=1 Tax=Penicillium salamii TaxID=1612424 RepID=A0A9W4K1A4_9EURO|nr:unnamed protein product [Penicillium salamii]
MAAVESDEYNLQDAWDRVCTSFAQTTKVDLTATPKFSVDEVLDQIRGKQEDDDERNNKYKTAKDVIGKTLKFVMVLGGIAAQGASMVFAPSSLCFNAISYLVNTGAKYKRIFSSLTELFRRISDVLERCKIYMRLPANAVDVALRKIINEELVCFVDICALSIKVLKGHKVFTALKVFAFDGDEGVSGQLARLASLVERESQMRATLGFESQKTTERGVIETREGTRKINTTVDKLLTFEKKRDADTVTKRLLDSIDSSLDNPSEAFKATQINYKRLLNDQVQGSGEWLQSDPLFTKWVSPEDSSLSVLGISGGEGYGKSFLFATIIQKLLEAHSHPADDLTCTSVAYYIFQGEKKNFSLVQALKTLAWQISSRDVVYRKDLASAKTEGISQIRDLWDVLFAKSYRSDSTFFLLLDGVDQADKKQLKELVHLLTEIQMGMQKRSVSWPQFKLRIVLSGRDETISKIKGHMGDGLSVIDVASKNSEDMEKFIIDRMNKMEILSLNDSDQVLSLRREILENLTTQTRGDFVNVGLLLHEISGKQRPGEIRDILSRSGGNRSDTIVRKIEQLNETLSDDDISDLNILLTWVVFSIRDLTLEELESVLTLKTGEASLRPLAEKITDQYSSLFTIKGEPHPITKVIPITSRVTLVSDSIERFLRTKNESESIEDSQELNLSGDVSEAEVRIVRRFLESVCDPRLFGKFGFDEFFQRKLKGKTARVGLDIETAHLRILATCLQALRSQDSRHLAFNRYAAVFFAEHLKQADPSLTQPQHKTALGPQLVSLFTDEKIIRDWWTPNNPWPRFDWIYSDEYAEVSLKWLQDSAVTKNLSDEESKWVKSLSSKSEPDADIMEHIARSVAQAWLQLGAYDVAESFAAVHGYITKIENRKNPDIKRSTEDPKAEEIDACQILEAAEWARKKLGLESFSYEENRNLARTLREYSKHDEATERFKLTSSLDKYNWFSQWGLATCYANQKEYALAIETVQDAINTIRCGDVTEDYETLPELDRDLAKWNEEAGDSATAFAIYEKVIRENPDDYEAALDMMLLFHKDKHYEGLLGFLESLKSSTDERTGLDRRTTAFHVHYANEEYHSALFALVSDGKAFDAIYQSYDMAIIAARERLAEGREKGDTDEENISSACLAVLMHNFALLCYQNGADDLERREFAIDQWVRILQIHEISDVSYLTVTKSYVRPKLANVCFKEALRDPASGMPYLEQLEQLAALTATDGEGIGQSGTYPSELLAWYHATQGDDQKSKDAVRTHVKRNIDILSDDDPLNDWRGYRGLARYFMCAGQDADALAAWSLIVPLDDTEVKSDPLESPSALKRKGPLNDVCDGDCETEWEYADDIYVCRECDYLEFDLGCLNKLRDGKLDSHICGKDHKMLHVPSFDPVRHEEIGEGNVMVGEEVLSVNDWLQRIKEQWGIRT